MTNFILLIGSALFSRAVMAFQINAFNHLYVLSTLIVAWQLTHHSLGADADSLKGDGPGTFDVRGNIWHLDCCNANNYRDGKGWLLFGALLGWTNTATRKGSSLCSLTPWSYLNNCSRHRSVLCILLDSCHRHARSPQVARGPPECIRAREHSQKGKTRSPGGRHKQHSREGPPTRWSSGPDFRASKMTRSMTRRR
jgi:hypothetical protein